jgi:hypothetical protein
MDVGDIKNFWRRQLYVQLENVSDDALLREIDVRGLNPGVSYTDLTKLTEATVQEDWEQVYLMVRKLSLYHLGRII